MATTLQANALSPNAIEMLGQLYVGGPTWDGNVVSKNGRGELVRAGLAWHEHGYAQLTPEGVSLAAEWDIRDLKRRNAERWIKKRRES
jgi:hypothetical protein